MAREGDITLSGRDVRQHGVVVATTSVNTRGTVHMNAVTAAGQISLGENAATAILIEADTTTTALDSQRDGLRAPAMATDANLVIVNDRRDQSPPEHPSGGTDRTAKRRGGKRGG